MEHKQLYTLREAHAAQFPQALKPGDITALEDIRSHDVVNYPKHYLEGRTIEPVSVIEDWKLDYHLGNALKYIARAGRKDSMKQDLAKAIWYIERKMKVYATD